jgi:flagellar basal-body rod protein FlgC
MPTSAISAMDISASALTAQRRKMNIIAGNIANAGSMVTPEGGPYRRRDITFATAMKSASDEAPSLAERVAGVKVAAVTVSDKPAKTVYDPQHPLADKQGFVRVPDINVTQEMVDMVSAQREYEANLAAMRAARDITRNSLSILRP